MQIYNLFYTLYSKNSENGKVSADSDLMRLRATLRGRVIYLILNKVKIDRF